MIKYHRIIICVHAVVCFYHAVTSLVLSRHVYKFQATPSTNITHAIGKKLGYFPHAGLHKDYKQTTTDHIELRVCADQATADEDVPVSSYEIYVK